MDATVTERKPGVFHAADNGKEQEAKQEYIEETQGKNISCTSNIILLHLYPLSRNVLITFHW